MAQIDDWKWQYEMLTEFALSRVERHFLDVKEIQKTYCGWLVISNHIYFTKIFKTLQQVHKSVIAFSHGPSTNLRLAMNSQQLIVLVYNNNKHAWQQ